MPFTPRTAAAGGGEAAQNAQAADDFSMNLDVPAFLRRSEG
jgi:hypothetical protein